MDRLWIITAVAAAFAITAISGMWLVPILHKLKFGQTILDIGPKWHKNKQGTPTMGGIMFIFGIVIAVVAGFLVMEVTTDLSSRPDSGMIKARLFYGLMLVEGWKVCASYTVKCAAATQISMALVYACIPLSGFLGLAFSAAKAPDFIKELRGGDKK